jgi:2-C-methyl-D-erythritol 4-phosphate cytidylyltransferase/2-C-methyl-D-erythritol 2,4-cyclodiphosphate synthase
MFVSAILAAGGRGTRLGAAVPKQLLPLGEHSMLQRSFDTLIAHDWIDEVVIALPSDLAAAPPAFLTSARKPVRVVDGGARRQDSVANAFRCVSERADVVVIHDAARPFATPQLFSRVIEAAASDGAAIAALQASDTVKEAAGEAGARTVRRTIARESVYLAQTPQAFTRAVLAAAIARGSAASAATDEASLAEQAGHAVRLVDGEPGNIKITTEEDLRVAEALVRRAGPIPHPQSPIPRIGVGYDLHRLEPGRRLMLGGVQIPHEMGLIGHSDADVLCHAITDAILGAAALGDIGRHFPNTDPRWKDADSIVLLSLAATIVRDAGFAISNIDAVVIAETPKLFSHVDAMCQKIADAMGIEVSAVSVKGKTNEKVGELGRGEAIAVHAVALLTHV